MMTRFRPITAALLFAAASLVLVPAGRVLAETEAQADAGLRADSRAALASLYSQTPAAKSLGEVAKAVLVFPNVVQAGVEKFGYALFLMTDSAVKYLGDSQGWKLGVGPEVVIVDQGAAAQLNPAKESREKRPA